MTYKNYYLYPVLFLCLFLIHLFCMLSNLFLYVLLLIQPLHKLMLKLLLP